MIGDDTKSRTNGTDHARRGDVCFLRFRFHNLIILPYSPARAG
jgi:hypothetical protein